MTPQTYAQMSTELEKLALTAWKQTPGRVQAYAAKLAPKAGGYLGWDRSIQAGRQQALGEVGAHGIGHIGTEQLPANRISAASFPAGRAYMKGQLPEAAAAKEMARPHNVGVVGDSRNLGHTMTHVQNWTNAPAAQASKLDEAITARGALQEQQQPHTRARRSTMPVDPYAHLDNRARVLGGGGAEIPLPG